MICDPGLEFCLWHGMPLPSTFLTVTAPLTIQKLWRSDVHVLAIPQWPTLRWWSSIISWVTWWSLGKIIGCLWENVIVDMLSLPPIPTTPSSSIGLSFHSDPGKRFFLPVADSKIDISREKVSRWTTLTVSRWAASNSSTVKAPVIPSWWHSSLLRRNI